MERIYAAIDTLSKDDQDIIEMRNLHSISWKLIGGIYGVNEKSMSSRYSKIMEKIRKILGIEKIVLDNGRTFGGKDIIGGKGKTIIN